MTLPNRQTIIRTIASSLAFDHDPPFFRSLDKARQAAADVTDALVAAGILPDEYADTDEPDVALNGNAEVDPDTAPLPF